MSHPDKHRSLPPDCIFGVCNTRAILASYTTLHKISLNRLIRYVSRGKRPEMKQLIDTPANSHDFPVDSASTFRPYRNTLPSPPVSGPPSPISFAPYQHKYICIYIYILDAASHKYLTYANIRGDWNEENWGKKMNKAKSWCRCVRWRIIKIPRGMMIYTKSLRRKVYGGSRMNRMRQGAEVVDNIIE